MFHNPLLISTTPANMVPQSPAVPQFFLTATTATANPVWWKLSDPVLKRVGELRHWILIIF